jgi:hypothetical protein
MTQYAGDVAWVHKLVKVDHDELTSFSNVHGFLFSYTLHTACWYKMRSWGVQSRLSLWWATFWHSNTSRVLYSPPRLPGPSPRSSMYV